MRADRAGRPASRRQARQRCFAGGKVARPENRRSQSSSGTLSHRVTRNGHVQPPPITTHACHRRTEREPTRAWFGVEAPKAFGEAAVAGKRSLRGTGIATIGCLWGTIRLRIPRSDASACKAGRHRAAVAPAFGVVARELVARLAVASVGNDPRRRSCGSK